MYGLKIYRGVIHNDKKRMMQNWRRNWLVVSKVTWEIWNILTRVLKNVINLLFIGPFSIKIYNAWAKKVQRSYIWRHWRLMQNLKENWFVLSRMTRRICQIFVHRLKSTSFMLENKMAELNQNKNSNQTDRPDAVWKFLFYLVNKWRAN